MAVQLVLTAVEEAPTLFDEAKAVFEELASKDDGLTKLTKAAAAFAALAGHAANSASVAAGSSTGTAPPKPVDSAELESARTPDRPLTEVPAGGVALSGSTGLAPELPTDPLGRPLDAAGQPILNAADQAAAVSGKPS